MTYVNLATEVWRSAIALEAVTTKETSDQCDFSECVEHI